MAIDKTQVARQFSRSAAGYDQVATLQRQMADQLLAEIGDRRSGALIDLGCGTGWALKRLSESTSLDLIGVDLASKMIDVARRLVPQARFLVEDLERTSLPSNSADYVFSNAALQWCAASSAIKEMKRLLKPDGRLLFSTFLTGTLGQWQQAWEWADPGRRRVHQFLSKSELQKLLVAAGLETIKFQVQTRTVDFDSVGQMIDSVKRLGATYAATDRSQQKLTRRSYQRFRQALTDQPGRGRSLTYRCVQVVARR